MFLELHRAKTFWLEKTAGFFPRKGKQKVNQGVMAQFNAVSDLMGANQFERKELLRWQRILEERHQFLKSQNVPYLFAIAPRKPLVYSEHLPDALQALKGTTRHEQLVEFLQTETEVPVVNLVEALNQAKSKQSTPPLYYKTDGHWNTLGAFHAYRALMTKADLLIPNTDITPMSAEQFNVRTIPNWSHPSFTAQLGFKVTEPFPYMLPVGDTPLLGVQTYKAPKGLKRSTKEKVPTKDNRLYKRGIGRSGRPDKMDISDRSGATKTYLHIENSLKTELNSILVLGDSFIWRAIYFFSAHAKHVYSNREVISFSGHLFQVDDLPKPDLVVQVISEGYLEKALKDNPEFVRSASSL